MPIKHPGEKSPKIPAEEIFYSRRPPLPLIPYCYSLKSCNFIQYLS